MALEPKQSYELQVVTRSQEGDSHSQIITVVPGVEAGRLMIVFSRIPVLSNKAALIYTVVLSSSKLKLLYIIALHTCTHHTFSTIYGAYSPDRQYKVHG